MRLNYTQRLIVVVGGYTFVLMAILLSVVWLSMETEETSDEAQRIAGYLEQAIGLISQYQAQYRNAPDPVEPVSPLKTDAFDLYLPSADIPAPFRQLRSPGYHQLQSGQGLLVGRLPGSGELYYVAFQQPAADAYLETEFDDVVVIIAAVVIATALAVLMVAILARRLAAPVILLKQQVDQLDVGSPELPLLDRDDELGELSRAFSGLIGRMREFARREQQFTRFASHELRSPVTVIRGNLDLLRESLPDTPLNQRILSRMNAATHRISLLIDGFLWLGREHRDADAMPTETVHPQCFRQLLEELLEGLSAINRQRIRVNIEAIRWRLKPLMLSILLDNLIRNALQHSHHDVCISAGMQSLRVSNPVDAGTDNDRQGIGLQIVSRICQANGWHHQVDETPESFVVSVMFAEPNDR